MLWCQLPFGSTEQLHVLLPPTQVSTNVVFTLLLHCKMRKFWFQWQGTNSSYSSLSCKTNMVNDDMFTKRRKPYLQSSESLKVQSESSKKYSLSSPQFSFDTTLICFIFLLVLIIIQCLGHDWVTEGAHPARCTKLPQVHTLVRTLLLQVRMLLINEQTRSWNSTG